MQTRILIFLFISTLLFAAMTSAQVLTTAPTSLAFGTSCILNTNNAVQSYVLTGTGLDGTDITITAPAGSLISFSPFSGYATTITRSGYLPNDTVKTIYVTFAPTSIVAYSDTIRMSGGGASEAKVAVTGTGSKIAIGDTTKSWLRPTGSGGVSTMTWEKTTDGGLTWASFSNTIQNTDSILIPGNDSLGIDQPAVKGYFKLWTTTGKFASVSGGAFDTLSTVEYPVGGPGGLIDISYGNLIFANNTTNQVGINLRVKTDLTIAGSTTKMKGASVSGTFVHTIGGNVLVSGAGSPALSCTDATSVISATTTWNIGGNLTNSGGGRISGFASAGSVNCTGTLNIGGNLVLTNGQFQYGSNGANNGVYTVNLKGNLINSGGLIVKQSGVATGVWNINFVGTTEQQITGNLYTKNETVITSFNVNNPAGVRIMNSLTQWAAFTMIQGNVTMNGASVLTYNASTNAKLVYAGSSAQSTGGEFPAVAVGGPNSVEINNPAGVTLSVPTNYAGTLTLTNGVFANGSNLTLGDNASIVRTGGSLSAAPTFGAITNVTYNTPSPAAAITTGFELPAIVRNLTINNTSGVTLNTAVVDSILTLSSGVFTNGSNLTLKDSASVIRSGGSLTAAPTFAGVIRNVSYLAPTPAASITTGFELPATVRNLVINNTSGVVLNTALGVDSLQLVAGNLSTSATNLLTVSSAKIVGLAGGSATSFINGPIAQTIAVASSTAKAFPIGKVAAYRPVTLTVTQDAATATTYTGEVFNTAPTTRTLASGHDKVSLVRYWNIAKGVGANITNGTIQINYSNVGTDDGVNQPTTLRIVKDDGAGNWVDLGGTGTATPVGSITSTINFTTFSDFTLANATGGTNPLPVQMTSFAATTQGMNADLCWKTETESDNYGFDIERRSVPNGDWNKIGFIAGAGTSTSPREYTFADKNLAAGKYAYRLKQMDNSGAFKYSVSTELEIAGMPKELTLAGNYPNPFNPTTKVQFTVPENGQARLRIYNIIGQEVANLFHGLAIAGNLYAPEFNASGMPSGLYFSVLEFGNKRLTSKMILAK